MLEIIPAIDLIGGKCVRLSQGDYARQTTYKQDPLDLALQFEDIGVSRLHMVDLDGAREGRLMNLPVLERVAARTHLVIDYGGGIKTSEDIRRVLDAGATIATVGSVAVKDPELFSSWLSTYGSDFILLGADVKHERMAVSGWQETTSLGVFDFLDNMTANGVTQAFCTDISKDGLLQGPSTELYRQILERYPTLQLIASGGVSSLDDLDALERAGCSAAIVGKAIYEGAISLGELESFINP